MSDLIAAFKKQKIPQKLEMQWQVTSGNDAGTGNAGLNTIPLNTIIGSNEITGSSTDGIKVTLPAGLYYAYGSCGGFRVGRYTALLTEGSVATTILKGTTSLSNTTASRGNHPSFIEGYFTLSGSTDVYMQNFLGSTKLDNGLGTFAGGEVEVYATLFLLKLDGEINV